MRATILLLLTLISTSFYSHPAWAQSQLTQGQKAILAKVEQHDNFKIGMVDVTVDGIPRTVVILGESHVKFAQASDEGKDVIGYFTLRGIENYSADDAKYWTAQGDASAQKTVQQAQWETKLVTTIAKFFVKGSTITDSWYTGYGFASNGAVFYQYKGLGLMIPADDPAVKKNDPTVSKLTGPMANVAMAHELIDGTKDAYIKIADPKVAADAAANPNPAIDVMLEYGSLSLFDADCRQQHTCEYIVNIRNRRMAANVLATLKAFPRAANSS